MICSAGVLHKTSSCPALVPKNRTGAGVETRPQQFNFGHCRDCTDGDMHWLELDRQPDSWETFRCVLQRSSGPVNFATAETA